METEVGYFLLWPYIFHQNDPMVQETQVGDDVEFHFRVVCSAIRGNAMAFSEPCGQMELDISEMKPLSCLVVGLSEENFAVTGELWECLLTDNVESANDDLENADWFPSDAGILSVPTAFHDHLSVLMGTLACCKSLSLSKMAEKFARAQILVVCRRIETWVGAL